MTKIIIIKLGALGDVLRTTCILEGLHKKYRAASISWLTAKSALCLLENNPLIDNVFPIEDSGSAELLRESYDLVISLDDDAIACNLAGHLTTRKFFGAYRLNDKTLYTDDSADWFDMSLISVFGKDEADKRKKENQRSYPDILFDTLEITAGKPSLRLNASNREFAQQFSRNHLLPRTLKIGLNTGAGDRWQFKQLSIQQTIDIAEHLSLDSGREILLFGGPAESQRNENIVSNSDCSIIKTGTSNTINDFAALIGLCDLLITSDSLAFHIASALDVATLVFFGPTSAAEIHLFSPGKKITSPLSCVCCYKKRCDFEPNCMDAIPTGEILQNAEELLSRARNKSNGLCPNES